MHAGDGTTSDGDMLTEVSGAAGTGKSMISFFFGSSTRATLLRALALIACIAAIDWRWLSDLPLGFLYLLPMSMVGRVLRPWQIAGVAVVCTFFSEVFDQFVWSFLIGMPRDVLYFTAFFCVGLFVFETNRNREVTMQHLFEIGRQRDARYEAEEQLKILIESSPAAIITADAGGLVLMANEAAHRMLGLEAGTLPGRMIQRYFSSLANVSRFATDQQMFRTVMQSRGQREDGEVFLAEICFSTYRTNAGGRLAAMILDASEDLRTREEASLHQMMAGSRIALGAVSHEIRNFCGAIEVVHQNLSRNELLAKNKDFEALGSLIAGLEKIATVELRRSPEPAGEVDLISVMDDFQVVVTPSLQEQDVVVRWNLTSDLPLVWADRATLMQVLLNLTTNSLRALAQVKDKALTISVRNGDGRVLLEFQDSGCGIAHPERLFHPFQEGAQVTGLGLYLSRAFMRSFGGDLRYEPASRGTAFVMEIPAAQLTEPVR